MPLAEGKLSDVTRSLTVQYSTEFREEREQKSREERRAAGQATRARPKPARCWSTINQDWLFAVDRGLVGGLGSQCGGFACGKGFEKMAAPP